MQNTLYRHSHMQSHILHVEEEVHCYVAQCRRIVCGQYVADYSTTECRTFRPEGLHQLRTKLAGLPGQGFVRS